MPSTTTTERRAVSKVSRLPVTTGISGWNAILPEAGPAAPLSKNVSADWMVVGAGIAGLAAARRLAQLNPADRIVVLEAGRLGEGAAGRNSGFMIDLPHDIASENYGGALDRDRAQIAANRHAIAFVAEAAEEFGLPAETVAMSGKVNAAASRKGVAHNADYARHLATLGEAYEALDALQIHELTGSRYYLGGLYTPGTAMVQPAMYVRGLAAGLAARGVAIHEGSPVTSLVRSGDAWRATTPGGGVTAGRVILTVNGHVESFGHFPRRLVHIHLYASMTRALTGDEVNRLGGAPVWGLTPADPMGTTVRRISGTGGDRIVVRNRCHYTPSLASSDRLLADTAVTHDRSFSARFPGLAGVEMQYRWAGALCLSLNDVPAWGKLDDGLYAACCQNGLGLARGTYGGMSAAELACGVDSEGVRQLSGLARPARLPPEPFAAIGATARIRWGEWKAGREL